jgi:hypothetical protein
MIFTDDRTGGQVLTHTKIVVALDTFMSGWGKAEGGHSYAGWACRDEDVDKVKAWVSGRSEMRHVRVVGRTWRPSGPRDHYHVYVVDRPTHAALRGDS